MQYIIAVSSNFFPLLSRHGAESDEVKSAMVRNDGLLKYLLDNLQALDGLDQRTNIIILGDHGMADHSSNHVVYLSDLGITLGDLKWVTGNMFTTGMMIPHNGLVNSVSSVFLRMGNIFLKFTFI